MGLYDKPISDWTARDAGNAYAGWKIFSSLLGIFAAVFAIFRVASEDKPRPTLTQEERDEIRRHWESK